MAQNELVRDDLLPASLPWNTGTLSLYDDSKYDRYTRFWCDFLSDIILETHKK